MDHSTTLLIQSWTLYAISITVIVSRLTFRHTTLGRFTRFQADDWLMVVVLLPYTISVVSANQVRTEQSTAERRYRYVLEGTQVLTVWLVKACLLILYWRILPTRTDLLKRRTLQGISIFCCTSFIVIQSSLLLWWLSPSPNNALYNTLLLTLSTIATALTMILPIPFVPTPRRLLLLLLLILSILVLASGTIARISILQHKPYLSWYLAESSLSILCANLPFLTSLLVTATPIRIRSLSSTLRLSPWPRSRQASFAYVDAEPVLGTARLDSMASTIIEITASGDVDKGEGWSEEGDGTTNGGVVCETQCSREGVVKGPAPPSPSLTRPGTLDGPGIPKTRLSGGLAEMGELSMQDTTQGWPIYWR